MTKVVPAEGWQPKLVALDIDGTLFTAGHGVVSQDAEAVTKFGEDTPMKRPAQPEEMAPAYVFFASNADSSYITGEVLTLLGGETTAA